MRPRQENECPELGHLRGCQVAVQSFKGLAEPRARLAEHPPPLPVTGACNLIAERLLIVNELLVKAWVLLSRLGFFHSVNFDHQLRNAACCYNATCQVSSE